MELLHIGSHVLVQGIITRTHLNHKRGLVVGQKEDLWSVVMLELEWSIRRENLKPLVSYRTGLKTIPTLICPFDFGHNLCRERLVLNC